MERLTLVRVREFARVKAIVLEVNLKKAVVISLIIEGLSQLQEAEPVEAEAKAAKPEGQEDIQIEDLSFNQLRRLAGVSQQEVAKAIRCNLDDYLNVEYWGRGKGISRHIAAKARAYLTGCIKQKYP